MFAQQLAGVRRLTPRDVRGYGVAAEELEDVKTRCTRWADTLQQQPDSEQGGGVSSDELRGLMEHRQASFPTPATDATRRQPGPSAQRSGRPADPDRGIER